MNFMDVKLYNGDCKEIMKDIPDNTIDSIVTDPPYGLSFMNKHWDYDVPGVDIWKECLRVLKPGGHLLSFGGSRTYHRMAVNIEDAGFEIRDQIMWIYGSGFPKSLNIGKQISKINGEEREVVGERHRNVKPYDDGSGWNTNNTIGDYKYTKGTSEFEGWGTALKPAHEPIVVARKPISEKSIAENVLKWGTGGLNIEGCRIPFISEADRKESTEKNQHENFGTKPMKNNNVYGDYSMIKPKNFNPPGRFPANIIHDGSQLVLDLFPVSTSVNSVRRNNGKHDNKTFGKYNPCDSYGFSDSGSAARFFYCAKASKSERNAGLDGFEERRDTDRINDSTGLANRLHNKTNTVNHHPTVKPISLMRYLCRLVTPPGGIVLDPFMGSGSTGKGAIMEGFRFTGIEKEVEYCAIAEKRIESSKNLTLPSHPITTTKIGKK